MILDDPAVLAEVEAAFAQYEAALVNNDIAVLDAFFLQGTKTIRYGIAENLYGSEAIASFRRLRPSAGLDRKLDRTSVSTFGRDFATVSTLFRRDSAPERVGRQMQTWVRMPDGWKITAAHVSIIDEPA